MAHPPSTSQRALTRSRNWIGISATTTLLGIASSVTEVGGTGRWLVIAGLLGLIVGLHRFGRSGARELLPPEKPT